MKSFFIILMILAANVSFGQFSKYFKKNMSCRIDYYHSGDIENEYYMLDEIIKEGKWYGSRKNLTDDFDYGYYKFMVYDSAAGNLIYSKGYSTLFLEYRSTEEAKSQCGNYPESVVFPFPKKTVRVDFYSRGKDLVWKKQFEVFVNPNDPEIIEKNDHFYKNTAIHKAGNPKKKLDLVFLPDGYTVEQMDKFIDDCKRFTNYLFATDPYSQNTGKINTWAVLAPSEESGTDIAGDSIFRNTLLNTNFYTFGSERYLTTDDFKMVRNVAANAPNDHIIILVNHDKYGGGGIYNFWSITTVDNVVSDFVFTHELGHGFFGLGDEYYADEVAVQDFYNIEKEPWEPNLTTLVDFDSKWKDMLPSNTPIPTPADDDHKGKTGVYEGGGYMTKGVYRPYINCSMNVVIRNNFCPVCRQSIQKMIDYYSK